MTDLTQYSLSNPAVISARAFDDEIVIANFSNGIYYSLRFVAAEVWLGLMAGVPVDRVVEALVPHGKESREIFGPALRAFIGKLEQEELIARTATRPADESWRPRLLDAPFDAPQLEQFSDMEDLLLLDPIHDMGKTGWSEAPHK
jgi:hypothetical protein